MKKLLILLLLVPCLCQAREVKRIVYEKVYIPVYETRTIMVKQLDLKDVTATVGDNVITLSNDTEGFSVDIPTDLPTLSSGAMDIAVIKTLGGKIVKPIGKIP